MKRIISILCALVLLAGCYESTLFTLLDNPYPLGPWPTQRAGLWESFDTGEVDLEGYSLVFSPARSDVVFYDWVAVDGLSAFSNTPGSGRFSTTLPLGDDDAVRYELVDNPGFAYYGEHYDSFFVGSNGYLTFGEVSDTSLSPHGNDHFRLPSISLLRGDLDPSDGGRVVVDEWRGRVVVTWEGVPQYGDASTNNDLQVVIHGNGVVELHYLDVSDSRGWLVGLSNGLEGTSPDESDFVGGSPDRERCDDGRDNDGDGLIDCADPDCASECSEDPERDCFNGLDDDRDGWTDCDDPDCEDECWVDYEWDCFNDRDDDGDGLWDCEDPDCEEACWEEREWDCFNDWDDDGDGLWDCEDPDCEEACWEEREWDCFNDWDDDGDGLWDCGDPDCEEQCWEEWEWDCFNGRDDDGDGWVDCDDDDCEEQCWEEWEWDCFNGWDDDGDGLTDCFDPDCEREPECWEGREWDCFNGRDDDGDGLWDCEDPDCREECGEEREWICDNGWDDDGDGRVDCDDPDCHSNPACLSTDGRAIWELFSPDEDFDLEGNTLIFFPDPDIPGGYEHVVEDGLGMFDEPGSGAVTVEVELGDDDFEFYVPELAIPLFFFDEVYESFFIGSNGYVTFGEGSPDLSHRPESLLALPTIAAFRSDLDPRAGGEVIVDEYPDHVTITFDGVPFFGESDEGGNTFQIALFADGFLIMSFEEVDPRRQVLVGIGNGEGGTIPEETDFF